VSEKNRGQALKCIRETTSPLVTAGLLTPAQANAAERCVIRGK